MEAKGWKRYLARQTKHANRHPGAAFSFEVVGCANLGKDLDVLEESWIRAGGGKKSVPGSAIQNSRVQMIDRKYLAAGGDVC